MVSRSSRPKNASRSKSPALGRLLVDGAMLERPKPELLDAARELGNLGLVEHTIEQYVVCANPQDSDYPPRVRSCPGKIMLDKGMDEDGDELRCPECDRPVYPWRYHKQAFDVLRTSLRPEGIFAYVDSRLAELQEGVRSLGPGVWKVDLGDMGLLVCLADYCPARYLEQSKAAQIPTCFIVVDSGSLKHRFLPEDWICRISLAELIAGDTELPKLIRSLADSGLPERTINASLPVYLRRPHPVQAAVQSKCDPWRRFIVELHERTVVINGVVVIPAQSRTGYAIFRMLWRNFLEDVVSGLASDQYRPTPVSSMIDGVYDELGEDAASEDNLRKAISRLQGSIEKAIRQKTGVPVDGENIIECLPWKGQGVADYGYRLNPRHILIGARGEVASRDLSQEK